MEALESYAPVLFILFSALLLLVAGVSAKRKAPKAKPAPIRGGRHRR